MLAHLRSAAILLALLSVLCGLAYPALVTGVATLLFPRQAAGSLVEKDGRVIGSELIGQQFASPRYFWGRPSATARVPYNAAASAGSNLGPSSPTLHEAAGRRIAALRAADPALVGPIPVDLVTASGSGLDPHVSPAAALAQVPRVATARGLPEAVVGELVTRHIEERQLGVLGEPRVNVLRLNLALDDVR